MKACRLLAQPVEQWVYTAQHLDRQHAPLWANTDPKPHLTFNAVVDKLPGVAWNKPLQQLRGPRLLWGKNWRPHCCDASLLKAGQIFSDVANAIGLALTDVKPMAGRFGGKCRR